ncbi:AVT1A [Symbiodinium necroappetens]|uniref:AVT1A protein n=1 Tax=Symbiodinium necroappetens TaxID=1628268 RepID=A0A812UVZ4_9DINO|nr:AVT1A [Symbiodinium necroappetens]
MSGVPLAVESGAPLAVETKDNEPRTLVSRRGVSLGGTVVTMLNVFVGGGSVVLPYAFRLSGWLFVPLLLAVGVLMGFTLWIMGFLLEAVDDQAEQMGVPRSQRDWGFIGYAAFGNVGRLLFAGCMFFDLTGGALVLVSIVIEQLPFLLPFRHNVTALLSCVLAFSCCLLPKRFFSIMAVLGMSSQVMLILGLVITGVELTSLNEVATDQTALKAAGVPSAFGIALLCFLAHSEAPLIYQMMEDRKQWTKAVIYSMTLTEAFLLTFGALGYGFFGGSVAQSIADNIGRDLELQVLPGGLNVLLGAIYNPWPQHEAAGDIAAAPRCHHRLVRRTAPMERSAADEGHHPGPLGHCCRASQGCRCFHWRFGGHPAGEWRLRHLSLRRPAADVRA